MNILIIKWEEISKFINQVQSVVKSIQLHYIPEVDDSKLNATTKPMAQEFGKAIYEFRANCWFNNINNIRNNAPCGVIYIKLFLYCLLYKKKAYSFFLIIYI